MTLDIAEKEQKSKTETANKEPSYTPYTTSRNVSYRNIHDLESECLTHMATNGFPFPSPLQVNVSKVPRFNLYGMRGKKNEWYIARSWEFKGRLYLYCIYDSWARAEQKHFEYKSWEHGDSILLSNDERNEFDRHYKEMLAQIEKERLARQDEAAKEAKKIWESASKKPNTPGHTAYLKMKGVKAHNVRFGKNPTGYDSLIIPLYNINGEIRSIQFISVGHDGTVYKRFLDGGQKSGCFGVIGNLKGAIRAYITEGYSTGATVFEDAGSLPVVIAFDCGNVDHVMNALRHSKKYGKLPIIIAADNDAGTEEEKGTNPGKEAAESAAKKYYNCNWVFPTFSKDDRLPNGEVPTDWNDMHLLHGPDAVKTSLQAIIQEDTNQPSTLTGSAQLSSPIRFWEQEGTISQQFPIGALPIALRHAAQEIARTVMVPVEMAAATVLSAAAASLQNKAIVIEKDDLEHYITFFIIVVGESSERKSSTFSKGMKPLLDFQADLEEKQKKLHLNYRAIKKIIDQQIKKITDNVKIDTKEEDAKRCAEQISILEEQLQKHEPPYGKFFTTDATEQAFVRCLKANNGCFSLLTSEGGDVIDYIAGAKSQNKKTNDSVYLKIVTNDPIGRERIGQTGVGESLYIPKSCGNILIMIQPNRFLEFMANTALRDCGLISRISPILAHENSMVGKRIELDEHSQPKIKQRADLAQYDKVLRLYLENERTIYIRLSQQAALERAKFHDSIEIQLGAGGDLRDVADIAGKSASFATKLAALFHLYSNQELVTGNGPFEIQTEISKETFLEAQRVQEYFLLQATNTQRTCAEDAWLQYAKDTLDWLQKKAEQGKFETFAPADIYNNFRLKNKGKPSSQETKSMIDLFIETGWVVRTDEEKERFSLRKW